MITHEQRERHEQHVQSLTALKDSFSLQVGGHVQPIAKTTLTGSLVLYKGWLWATVLGVREDCKNDVRRQYAFVIKSLGGSGQKWLCTRGSFKIC